MTIVELKFVELNIWAIFNFHCSVDFCSLSLTKAILPDFDLTVKKNVQREGLPPRAPTTHDPALATVGFC